MVERFIEMILCLVWIGTALYFHYEVLWVPILDLVHWLFRKEAPYDHRLLRPKS
jgi:hypothetical protein